MSCFPWIICLPSIFVLGTLLGGGGGGGGLFSPASFVGKGRGEFLSAWLWCFRFESCLLFKNVFKHVTWWKVSVSMVIIIICMCWYSYPGENHVYLMCQHVLSVGVLFFVYIFCLVGFFHPPVMCHLRKIMEYSGLNVLSESAFLPFTFLYQDVCKFDLCHVFV